MFVAHANYLNYFELQGDRAFPQCRPIGALSPRILSRLRNGFSPVAVVNNKKNRRGVPIFYSVGTARSPLRNPLPDRLGFVYGKNISLVSRIPFHRLRLLTII